MKRLCVFSLLVLFVFGLVGCQVNSAVQTADQVAQKHEQDVRIFAKIGTTLALQKAKLPQEKVGDVRAYAHAIRGLVAVSKPDFTGARALAVRELPEGSRAVGLAIIDIVERYVPARNPDTNAEQYVRLAGVALDSVVQAIDEYYPTATTMRTAGLAN